MGVFFFVMKKTTWKNNITFKKWIHVLWIQLATFQKIVLEATEWSPSNLQEHLSETVLIVWKPNTWKVNEIIWASDFLNCYPPVSFYSEPNEAALKHGTTDNIYTIKSVDLSSSPSDHICKNIT